MSDLELVKHTRTKEDATEFLRALHRTRAVLTRKKETEMSEREQRIRWLRGQIQAMLLRGDDIECLPLVEELERLEHEEGDMNA